MFIPIPLRFIISASVGPRPIVNSALIALNVLVYAIGVSADPLWVGPGSGIFSPLTYAFVHAGAWHLVVNMWALLLFGAPVNRRLGNGYYLLAYLGAVVSLGLFARLFCSSYILGASGAVFAVMAISFLLMPTALVEIGYLALFPMTLLLGLIWRPSDLAYWFIRWDRFELRAFWFLLLVPLLELWSLFWTGLNWANLGHLLGLLCGVAIVLLLPANISLNQRRASPAY